MRSRLAVGSLVLSLGAVAGLLGHRRRADPARHPAHRPAEPADPHRHPRPDSESEPGTPSGTPGGPPEVVDTLVDGLEVPWGVDFLPDGEAVVTERISGRVDRVGTDGEVSPLGTVAERRTPGRGRPPRRRRVPGLRDRPDAVPLPDHRHGQPGRPGRARRRSARTHDGRPRRHPGRLHPRRRAHRLRPRRPPLRHDRRDRRPRAGPGPAQPGREDPPDHPRRRPRARQPRPRLPGVVAGPPQRAGPRVGRRGAPVGLGVRRLGVGRAQPRREGRQLRLAARSRVPAATRRTSTRSSCGRSTRPRRAGWPSPTATCGWRACAASGCGASRSPPTGRRRSRGRSSARSTGGCAPWPSHPTGCSG